MNHSNTGLGSAFSQTLTVESPKVERDVDEWIGSWREMAEDDHTPILAAVLEGMVPAAETNEEAA